MSSQSDARARSAWAFVLLALGVAAVYWPGLAGFWGRDDFAALATARMLGSPWPLFSHDHFPLPGSIFRPLGFASMWLTTAWLGTDYRANALADLALHLAVCCALFRVVRLALRPLAPALLCALLFAVHPAVIGTALWWSDRFDL